MEHDHLHTQPFVGGGVMHWCTWLAAKLLTYTVYIAIVIVVVSILR
jgi:hypothetical protein